MEEEKTKKQLTKNQKRLQFILAIILTLLIGFFILGGADSEEIIDTRETSNTSTSTAIDIGGVVTTTDEQEIPDREWSLSRDISWPNFYTKEVKTASEERISEIISKIEADSGDVDAYVDLGLEWKMVNDYEGAELAWGYASELSPTYYLPLHNLGSLYLYDMDQPEKAESKLLKAVESNPQFIESWRTLHDLYRYKMPEMIDDADNILMRAVEENPESTDLVILLATYYRDTGDSDAARTWYEEALKLSQELGNTSLEAEVLAELRRL